jgi:putative heme degradation protein
MMRKFPSILLLSWTCAVLVLSSTRTITEAFSLSPSTGSSGQRVALSTTQLSATEPTLTETEEKVYGFLKDIHESQLQFRIVVIGNGAVLESSHALGPTMSLSHSSKSGANLVTFASQDKSFELHLQTSAISKVAMVAKETPGRTMRILRLLNDQGKSICSLILSEDSETTAEWFRSMTYKYGEEWQV